MALQYKVPENIDIEDKIIGPLTFKQFMYLLVAFAVTLVGYQVVQPGDIFMFTIFISPVWAIAGILGFARPNDRPADVFVISGIVYLFRPRQRIWRRETEGVVDITTKKAEKKKEAVTKEAPEESQLETLSRLIDTQGFIDDKKGTVEAIDPFENQSHESGLAKYLEKIKEQHTTSKAAKKEPLISELSTVSPTKSFEYGYKDIPLSDDSIVEMAKSFKGSEK